MAVETALTGDDDAVMAALAAGVPPEELATQGPQPAPPISKDLDSGGYRGLRDTNAQKEFELRGTKFKLVRELPGATLLDLALAGDPAATDMERLRGIRAFLEVAVEPTQNALFQRVLRSSEPTIGMDELMKKIEEISELLTDRPTE